MFDEAMDPTRRSGNGSGDLISAEMRQSFLRPVQQRKLSA
jgi:hypothetical protein